MPAGCSVWRARQARRGKSPRGAALDGGTPHTVHSANQEPACSARSKHRRASALVVIQTWARLHRPAADGVLGERLHVAAQLRQLALQGLRLRLGHLGQPVHRRLRRAPRRPLVAAASDCHSAEAQSADQQRRPPPAVTLDHTRPQGRSLRTSPRQAAGRSPRAARAPTYLFLQQAPAGAPPSPWRGLPRAPAAR